MSQIAAPWTAEQVEALNAWQKSDYVHPFTCGGDRMDADHRKFQAENGGDFGQLVAVNSGWVCPVCAYRQYWAHDFMFDPSNLPLATVISDLLRGP